MFDGFTKHKKSRNIFKTTYGTSLPAFQPPMKDKPAHP